MFYDSHRHPRPGILELLEDEFALPDRRDDWQASRGVFPDLSPDLRNQLWHSGYRTRESVARATDTELRHYVHAWGVVGHMLGLHGLRTLRAVIPYEPSPE
jgi:hypothetical protein